MRNSKARSSLLGLAGAYLVYLAWSMIESMQKGESTMAPWLSVVFAAFFGLAGIAVLIYAWRDWRKADQNEAKDENTEQTPEAGIKKE